MCSSPCCETGKLENVKDNTLTLECSNCGTMYDLIESKDFKKYDSPVRKESQVPDTDHDEEERTCDECGNEFSDCTCEGYGFDDEENR